MKHKYNPKQYWKDKIGFDCNKELLIYQYLCGTIKKRKIKQLDDTKRFQEYKTWKSHVENSFPNLDNDNLVEFYHFIKSNARSYDNILDIYTHWALPFIIAVFATWFIPKLLDSAIHNDVQAQSFSFLEQIIFLVIYSVVIIICFLLIAYPFIYIMRDYTNSKNVCAFWEDYLEIIELEMNTRQLKTPFSENGSRCIKFEI